MGSWTLSLQSCELSQPLFFSPPHLFCSINGKRPTYRAEVGENKSYRKNKAGILEIGKKITGRLARMEEKASDLKDGPVEFSNLKSKKGK
jgi:hypothetical protein